MSQEVFFSASSSQFLWLVSPHFSKWRKNECVRMHTLLLFSFPSPQIFKIHSFHLKNNPCLVTFLDSSAFMGLNIKETLSFILWCMVLLLGTLAKCLITIKENIFCVTLLELQQFAIGISCVNLYVNAFISIIIVWASVIQYYSLIFKDFGNGLRFVM